MSYERRILQLFAMPTREQVQAVLLQTLLRHQGTIKEFAAGEEIVSELAAAFGLTEEQRAACLETTYRKENRLKKSVLWHRLLFRAADELARAGLVSRPTDTLRLTNRREWMLTEKGLEHALRISGIPVSEKDRLPTKSYELEKIVKQLRNSARPVDYNPVDPTKRVVTTTREGALRSRAFRQAVIRAYECHCAVCGLKMSSPDCLTWEIEAAHIVPHRWKGRDDIWNGIALCRLHHWAFDVGWFTLRNNGIIEASLQIDSVSAEFGRIGNYEVFRRLGHEDKRVKLPSDRSVQPHPIALQWHRTNIFRKSCNVL